MRVKDARQTFLGIWIKQLIQGDPIKVYGDGLQIRDLNYVDDVVEAFMRALADRSTIGKSLDLCGPDVMTLEQIVRLTARAANLPCHILPLPDFVAALQGAVMGMLPGKPFSSDNYRSLALDSVPERDGLGALGIAKTPVGAIVPTLLAGDDKQKHLDLLRQRRA